MTPQPTKRCRVCRKDRAVSQFGPSDRSNDGLRSVCKPCRRSPEPTVSIATAPRRQRKRTGGTVVSPSAAPSRSARPSRRRAGTDQPTTTRGRRAQDNTYAHRPMVPGRQTQPANYNPFGLTGWYFIPKRQYGQIDVTELDITQFSAEQMLALLPDLVPEVGKAVWNFLRIAAPHDVSFQALTLAGEEDSTGQGILDELVAGVNARWGGMPAVLTQLLMCAYLQGATAAEAAPTKTLKDLEDIYVVNPDSVFFERDTDQRLVPYQRQFWWQAQLSTAMMPVLQQGPFRQMNEETFFYTPVDPYVDDPYGRPPAAPVLQTVFGLVQVLRDLQAVVHNQGWPKIDIKLIWEMLSSATPELIKADEKKFQVWLDSKVQEVARAYATMEPEDAFVHMDYVEVDSQNASSGTKLFDVAAVVHVFRIELIEALKSLPIFHSEHVGSTETYGSIEYEIYASSVTTLRQNAALTACRALEVGMQYRGHQAHVVYNWKPIRTTQRLADAQAESQEIVNEVNKRDQGFITQDDASNAITGSDAVGLAPIANPAPVAPPKPFPQQLPTEGETETTPEEHMLAGHGMAMAMTGAAMRRMVRRAAAAVR